MSKKITTEEFKKKIYDIYGDKYTVISEYKNNATKVLFKCNVCGGIFSKIPPKITGVSHEGCYICSGKNKHKTTEYFKNEIEEKYPNTYEILGEYSGARTLILVKRKECDHTYYVSPDNLLRGKGCPKCSMKQSSYMDYTENILQNMNIEFIKEKRFDDCKNIRALPFDYFLPKYNCCIEVDGEFHFVKDNNFPTNKNSNFELVSERDRIKTEFCKNNGILLIRLPYYYKKFFEDIIVDSLHFDTEVIA